MTVKKYIEHVICLSIICLGNGGCSDFLDKQPDSNNTEVEMFSRFAKVEQLVSNSYGEALVANRTLVYFNHMSSACITDECEGTVAGNNVTNLFNNGSWNAYGMPGNSDQQQMYWASLYTGIRNTNIILEGIAKYQTPDNPLQPGMLERRIGEVYFLRAYFHYLVMLFYGEAPYIDKVINVGDGMAYTRESVHMIVSKIVADVEQAMARVPEKCEGTDYGRVDQGACLGLIAMAKWIAATPLWNGAAEHGYTGYRSHESEYGYNAQRWEEARDAALAVINYEVDGVKRYSLFTGYSKDDFKDDSGADYNGGKVYRRLWAMFHETEAIKNEFIWVNIREKEANWQGDHYPPTRSGGSRSQPTQEQVDEYEYIAPDGYGYPIYANRAVNDGYDDGNPYESVKRDPRFYRDIMYHGSTFRNSANVRNTINTADGADKIGASEATKTGYYLRKFFKESWNKTGNFNFNTPIWRLPEFIYIYCEAVNELSGPNQEIYDMINRVRERSFMAPMPPAAKSDYKIMQEYIQRERRVEFFYENKRPWMCRLYLEPDNVEEKKREIAWQNAGSTNDQRSQNYWKSGNGPYPKCQHMINGMRPVEDASNGKITVNGKKYRMERFCVEERVFVTPRHYLFPIMVTELKKAPLIMQNPNWETE